MRVGVNHPSEPRRPNPSAGDDLSVTRSRLMDRTNPILVPLRIAAAILTVAALYFARSVLIPIALALLLSFLLGPMVGRLRRRGVPKLGAVMTSVSVAALVMTVVIVAVAFQAVELAESLPQYRTNIESKLETLRTSPGGKLDRFLKTIRGLNGEAGDTTATNALTTPIDLHATSEPAVGSTVIEPPPKPVPVEVVEHSLTPLDVLGALVAPALTAGIVIVLVVFILLAREDMRNRIIYMLGNRPGQMYVTTQVLDDAAARVSRYLLMQLIVAVCYGFPIGVGLSLIGVPSAVLWGLLAIALRFVPYIGPWVAAAFPTLLAFAVDPGWSMVLWTALLFVVVELALNNIIEPWLYGSSTGMSPVGVLLCTVFWASLWGPVGLIVATPLTACLVALGRYIPGLSALTLLLGDQPVLPLHVRVYQRMLALDPDEPDDIACAFLKDHSLEELYGQVFIPALKLIEFEHRNNPAFDREHYNLVIGQFRELITDVSDHLNAQTKSNGDANEGHASRTIVGKPKRGESELPVSVLCVPAQNDSDELLAQMMSVLLSRQGVSVQTVSAGLLASERLERLEHARAASVCICALPPYATVHVRNMIRRIRTRNDDRRIVVLFSDEHVSVDELGRRIASDGSVMIVTSLDHAVAQLRSPHVNRIPTSNAAVPVERLGVDGRNR